MGPSYIIYALCDPNTGKVRYVGKTLSSPESRLQQHLSEARSTRPNPRNPKIAWLRELMAQGKKPVILALEELPEGEFQDNWRADRREAEWIAGCVAMGEPLTNTQHHPSGFSVRF